MTKKLTQKAIHEVAQRSFEIGSDVYAARRDLNEFADAIHHTSDTISPEEVVDLLQRNIKCLDEVLKTHKEMSEWLDALKE